MENGAKSSSPRRDIAATTHKTGKSDIKLPDVCGLNPVYEGNLFLGRNASRNPSIQ